MFFIIKNEREILIKNIANWPIQNKIFSLVKSEKLLGRCEQICPSSLVYILTRPTQNEINNKKFRGGGGLRS